nr:hypothetical protein RSP597_18720 [Ralstonia solanacearum]
MRLPCDGGFPFGGRVFLRALRLVGSPPAGVRVGVAVEGGDVHDALGPGHLGCTLFKFQQQLRIGLLERQTFARIPLQHCIHLLVLQLAVRLVAGVAVTCPRF